MEQGEQIITNWFFWRKKFCFRKKCGEGDLPFSSDLQKREFLGWAVGSFPLRKVNSFRESQT